MNPPSLPLAALLLASAALAAPAAAQTRAAPAAQASAPAAGRGTGPASAPGIGRRQGARFGADYTPGWALMTPQERTEHRSRVMAMTNHSECVAHTEQHHEQMVARAQERGKTPPARPPRDRCAWLKP